MYGAKTRRDFIIDSTKAGFVVAAVVNFPGILNAKAHASNSEIPASMGYLLVDSKKCQGCRSCMLGCSLVNEGNQSLRSSRIQVIQDSFKEYPKDITIAQCRQCEEPNCLEACVTGALHIDKDNGNVRSINPGDCIMCGSCVAACPHTPSRSLYGPNNESAIKCDLCVSASYKENWPFDEKGGPGGKQACVENCSLKAIQFTLEMPNQIGNKGYDTNLRLNDLAWWQFGYPILP